MNKIVLCIISLAFSISAVLSLNSCSTDNAKLTEVTAEETLKEQEIPSEEPTEEAVTDVVEESVETPVEEMPEALSDEQLEVQPEDSAEVPSEPAEVTLVDATEVYGKLCGFIKEKGTESEGAYKYSEKITDISNVILELDKEGKMTWSCTFEEEATTTVLSVSVKEINDKNDVSMTMIKNDTGEMLKWNGVLDTSTFNVTDFNTLDIQLDSEINEAEMIALKINTQITVLGADVVMTGNGLEGASAFGFCVDVNTADDGE